MSGQRLRRLPDIKPAPGQRLVRIGATCHRALNFATNTRGHVIVKTAKFRTISFDVKYADVDTGITHLR